MGRRRRRLLIGLGLALVGWHGVALAGTEVYVANAGDGTLGLYALDEARGALAPQGTVEAGPAVMSLAVSPDRRFLYADIRSEPYRVVSFALDPATGAAARKAEAPLPDNMAYIATDRSGRLLLGASYFGDKIALSPIGADGLITQAANQVLATGRNAHCIQADRDNRFVFVTNLGSDQILQYRLDAAAGRLSENDPPLVKTASGEGPRHFVLSPDNRFLYVVSELRGNVIQYEIDPAKGTLTERATASILPPGETPARIWAADLKITPDGRFLYATERTASRITLIALTEGAVPRAVAFYPTETQPRGIAISPSGHYLVASGEKSDRLSLYRIDPSEGTLSLAGRALSGKGANWVEIVELP